MPPDTDSKPALLARGLMYALALLAGVVLVLAGHTSAADASGFVSPFLVVFEGARHQRGKP
jgi:hypothetical protein